ncbi:MAG: hypothetical protein AB4352_26590 [Hormoscilla sp.]
MTAILKTAFNSDKVVATASFDSQGRPREYVMYDENVSSLWAQTAMQSLFLKLLLEVAFGLDGFDGAIARSQGLEVAIEKSSSGYKAMLFRAQ